MLCSNRCYLCSLKTGSSSLICDACWDDLLTGRPACQRCGRSIVHTGICTPCITKPAYIDRTITLSSYQFPVNRMLRALKYQNQLLLAKEFGKRLGKKILAEQTVLPELIVPVPLHPLRLFNRGYNQSLEIARTISKEIGIPLDYMACKRTKNTQPQFGLKPQERKKISTRPSK